METKKSAILKAITSIFGRRDVPLSDLKSDEEIIQELRKFPHRIHEVKNPSAKVKKEIAKLKK